MSNESGASSGTSGVRRRGTVAGVPKRCWCDERTVDEIDSELQSCLGFTTLERDKQIWGFIWLIKSGLVKLRFIITNRVANGSSLV